MGSAHLSLCLSRRVSFILLVRSSFIYPRTYVHSRYDRVMGAHVGAALFSLSICPQNRRASRRGAWGTQGVPFLFRRANIILPPQPQVPPTPGPKLQHKKMLFRSQAICLVCAAATAAAFAPINSMKLSPRDFISPRQPMKQRGNNNHIILSPTSRYLNTLSDIGKNKLSMQSTLTSDEEASKATEEEEDAIPELPSMNEHGIFEIINADQHNAWLKANPDKLMVMKAYAPW